MLAKYSIRLKITLVVSFLLLAMCAMAGLALRQMYAMNSETADIAQNWLPSVRVLGDLRGAELNYRATVRAHILANDEVAKKIQNNALQREGADLEDLKKAYVPLIASSQERALYDDFTKSWEEYTSAIKRVIELSFKNQGTEARDYNATILPIGVRADDALQKAVGLNHAGAMAAGQRAADGFNSALTIAFAAVAVAISLGSMTAMILIRDVSSGIKSIIFPMQALGAGDLTAEVPHQGEKTEIGAMADTLQVFKQALIDKREADRVMAVDADAKITRAHRVDEITRNFEVMINEVVETVSSASTELEASARTLSSTAERAQSVTTAVAVASELASSNVQSVASATEEMASSVNEISRQVQESAGIANQAVTQAQRTNDRVSELAIAAARIGDVVDLINKIAGQTNLLALNATIEAARAGDAGRGFAVVASEVKALAEQTAKATGEISTQISGIQAATHESVGAIRDIGDTIRRMSEIASTIASAVEEQGAATQEISRNVQRAAQGTQQVSENIVDVQRGASETGSASIQVLSAAQSLSSDSTRLKVEVSGFLRAVGAA